MAARLTSLQFVAFTFSPPKKSAVELWQELFGGLPKNFQQLPMGGSAAGGEIEDFTLNIQVQQNRVDVIVGPPEPNPAELNKPPHIDDAKGALKLGSDLIKRIAASEDVHRPATVFQTSDEAIDAADAAQRVLARVPGLPSPAGATDLNFQVIVPRQSATYPEITINRLARWSTARHILLAVGGSAVGIQSGPSVALATEYVDVFPSEHPMVGHERFDLVLDEIVQEAMDILSRGYASFE